MDYDSLIVQAFDALLADQNALEYLRRFQDNKGFMNIAQLLQTPLLETLRRFSHEMVAAAFRRKPSQYVQLSADGTCIRKMPRDLQIAKYINFVFSRSDRFPELESAIQRSTSGFVAIHQLLRLFPQLRRMAAPIPHLHQNSPQRSMTSEQVVMDALTKNDVEFVVVSNDHSCVRKCTLLERVKRVVEYYFSDKQRQHDTHLQQLMAQRPDGSVHVRDLLTYPRLQTLLDEHEPRLRSIDESVKFVTMALAHSHQLEVNRDGYLHILSRDEVILRLIEYWLGPDNLPKDSFLRSTARDDPAGFIPLSVLVTFQKLRSMSVSVPEIVKALKRSSSLELSPDETMVRPLQPDLLRYITPVDTMPVVEPPSSQNFGTISLQSAKERVLKVLEGLFADANLMYDSKLRDKVESHPEHYVNISDLAEMPKWRGLCSTVLIARAQLSSPATSPTAPTSNNSNNSDTNGTSSRESYTSHELHFNSPEMSNGNCVSMIGIPMLSGNSMKIAAANYQSQQSQCLSSCDRPLPPSPHVASPPSVGSHFLNGLSAAPFVSASTVSASNSTSTTTTEYHNSVSLPSPSSVIAPPPFSASSNTTNSNLVQCNSSSVNGTHTLLTEPNSSSCFHPVPSLATIDTLEVIGTDQIQQILCEVANESKLLQLDPTQRMIRRADGTIPEFRHFTMSSVCALKLFANTGPCLIPQSFSVMSYNILADSLASVEVFTYAQPYLEWNQRKGPIRKEICFYMPDILCVQELQSLQERVYSRFGTREVPLNPDRGDHLVWFQKWLLSAGYSLHYRRKQARADQQPLQGLQIGILLAWKEDVFDAEEILDFSLSDELLKLCENDVGASILRNYNQVASFGLLRHRQTGRKVVVCSTHLTANHMASHIQLLQCVVTCRAMEQLLSSRYKNCAYLLSGDLNSVPGSAVYRFLMQGELAASTPECLEIQKLGIRIPESGLKHRLRLNSAYHSVLGHEPNMTNVTDSFRGTLDYIFYGNGPCDSLTPLCVLDTPRDELLLAEQGLPNARYPSDHVPLLSRFHFD